MQKLELIMKRVKVDDNVSKVRSTPLFVCSVDFSLFTLLGFSLFHVASRRVNYYSLFSNF